MNSFILKGHVCYCESNAEIVTRENAFAICIDGLSQGVFDEIPSEYRHLPVIDHSDKLIIPGMVDLHTHAPQYAFRGMCMDLELMDWLNQYTFPEEEKYEDLAYAEDAYTDFVEALRSSATTRACIFATRHRPATELLMRLMEESGLISYVGKVNMDRGATDALQEDSVEESVGSTLEWIEGIKGAFSRTLPILTPRFIPSCTNELMEQLREIQMAYGVPVQSHLSENPGEIDFVKMLRPENRFYGEAYNDYDLFGFNDDINTDVKTVMAHCVWSPAEEVDLMRRNGVFVAHCPTSNMNLSSGIAPIRTYLDLGLNVGLGSDIAGGHSISLFEVLVDAIQASKLYWRYINNSASPISFSEAFYLATKGGGAFFGKVGSFEAGYEFDAVVIDDSKQLPRVPSLLQRLERAVYLSLDEKALCAKYVKGKVLF